MAVWIYRRENKAGGVVIEPGDEGWNKLIAQDVSPEHGPLLALAPRMEEFLRDMSGLPERVSWGDAMAVYSCSLSHAQGLIRELDAAKESL
jgi:hypothetical protein